MYIYTKKQTSDHVSKQPSLWFFMVVVFDVVFFIKEIIKMYIIFFFYLIFLLLLFFIVRLVNVSQKSFLVHYYYTFMKKRRRNKQFSCRPHYGLNAFNTQKKWLFEKFCKKIIIKPSNRSLSRYNGVQFETIKCDRFVLSFGCSLLIIVQDYLINIFMIFDKAM